MNGSKTLEDSRKMLTGGGHWLMFIQLEIGRSQYPTGNWKITAMPPQIADHNQARSAGHRVQQGPGERYPTRRIFNDVVGVCRAMMPFEQGQKRVGHKSIPMHCWTIIPWEPIRYLLSNFAQFVSHSSTPCQISECDGVKEVNRKPKPHCCSYTAVACLES